MSGVQILAVAPADDGRRIDRWLREQFPGAGHARIQRWLRKGQVRVDGGRVKPGTRLVAGQQVRIPPYAEIEAKPRKKNASTPVDGNAARDLRASVLYQDDDVIAINKPAGLAVQGGTGTRRHLDGMLDALKFGAAERPRLVHRLDKDTSGVLLLARHGAAARWLGQGFKSRDARKLYWSIVVGVPTHPTGIIDMKIAKSGPVHQEKMSHDPDQGKGARTIYHVIDAVSRTAAWLAMVPTTGRTHQLRVHAAEGLQRPILGDGKYGGAGAFLESEGIARQLHLHARAIRVSAPSGQALEVTAPPPPHIEATAKTLGFDLADGAHTFDWLDESDMS